MNFSFIKYRLVATTLLLFLVGYGCKPSTPTPPAPTPMPNGQPQTAPPPPPSSPPPPVAANPSPEATQPASVVPPPNVQPQTPQTAPAPVAESVQQQRLTAVRVDDQYKTDHLDEYTYDTKTQYMAKMRMNLGQLTNEIEGLRIRVALAGGDVQTAAQPKLDALRAEVDKFKTQLDQLDNTTAGKWDSFKQTVDSTFIDLKKSCDDTNQWWNDQFPPRSP